MNHLNTRQKADLLEILEKHKKLFEGTLGVYPHKKFHIELEEKVEPVHSRPYEVPYINLETFKKESKHLIELGVLSPQGAKRWV